MTVLLEVKGLEVSYGHIAAVKGIDFALNAGEITSLVGANGAGKSTTLLALSGLIPKSQGEVRGQILFEGRMSRSGLPTSVWSAASCRWPRAVPRSPP